MPLDILVHELLVHRASVGDDLVKKLKVHVIRCLKVLSHKCGSISSKSIEASHLYQVQHLWTHTKLFIHDPPITGLM